LRLGEGGAETLRNCFSHMRKEIQIYDCLDLFGRACPSQKL